MRHRDVCGADPAAIPTIGAIIDIAPDDWLYETRGQRLRIRVDRVLSAASRGYSGRWVWVEGSASVGGSAAHRRQALIRVNAIPPDSCDPDYRPCPTGSS